LKPVCPELWKQAQNISRDLRSSQFVRLSVDSIADDSILVYPYFTKDLMSFVKSHEISTTQTKRILLDVLKGLKELHDGNWVHTGNATSSSGRQGGIL
jgi:serine/threonine protein kinase